MNSANKIAEYFLSLQEDDFGDVTNMKLQKLLYYAQGFHLALNGVPLFQDEMESWTHGPVVPRIYRLYKENGSSPIPRAKTPVIGKELAHFLDEIYKVYGQFSAWKLRNMTHNEAPFVLANGGTISHESMKDFFKTRIEKKSL